MAVRRLADNWDHTAAIVTAALNANPFRKSPAELPRNPYRPGRKKTEAERERESRDGWRMLETGLREMGRGAD